MEAADTLFVQSHRALEQGSPHEALELLARGLRNAPSSAWGLAHYADVLYVHIGRYEEAVKNFSRALELDPAYVWARAHRGAAFERLNRFEEAEADLSDALSAKPEYTWALAMLARVYQMTGQFAKAFAAVEQVVEKAPTLLPHWREERAMMRMLLGRHEDAELHFQIALVADPTDRFAHYNSTVNYVYWHGTAAAQKRIEALRERLERTIRESSSSRDVDRSIYELGGLAALTGAHAQALEHLHTADRREVGLVLLSPARKRARVDKAWDSLRQHPNFVALVEGP